MLDFKVGSKIDLNYKKPEITKELMSRSVLSTSQYGAEKTQPKLTIQITAYNEREGLLKCLDRLKDQSYKKFEVVLVDNGIDEDIKEAIKSYDLTYILASHNLGCTKGRNVGAAYANAELIAFIDADGYVGGSFVKNALAAMQDNSIVASRGKVLPLDINESVPGHYNMGDDAGECIISTEGNSIWRTKDYKKVGGFEDSLAGAEGLVICYRMHKLYGYNIDSFRYDPSFVLYHDFHSNKKQLESKLFKQSVIQDAVQKNYPDIDEFKRKFKNPKIKPRANKDTTIALAAKKAQNRVKQAYSSNYREKYIARKSSPSTMSNFASYDFTVVIPCYNLGSMLLDALDSVMMQSLDRVQVVIVDDASPDEETKIILDGLGRNYDVIRLNKNGGVAKARNAGAKKAKAKYVLCLDADDTIEPTYLEKARSMFLMDDSVGIVTCWANYFGGINGQWNVSNNVTLKDALISSPVHTASAFRLEAFNDAKGYEENMRGYEDWELWLSIIEKKWKVASIPEVLFNYFVRPNSKVKTSNKNADKLLGVIIENHRKSYEDNMVEVIAEKHRQVVGLRSELSDLKNRRFSTMLLNMPRIGKILKLSKRAFVLLRRHFSELALDYKESKSIYFFMKSLRNKLSNFTNRLKVGILGLF